VLPVGTAVTLRTVAPIDAREAQPREGFAAVLAAELVDASKQVLASAGSPVKLVVLETPAGHTLGWSAIMIYGNWRVVSAPAGGPAPIGKLERAVSDLGSAPLNGHPDYGVSIGPKTVQVPPRWLLAFRLEAPAHVEGVQ
jgi:hypothetical protein